MAKAESFLATQIKTEDRIGRVSSPVQSPRELYSRMPVRLAEADRRTCYHVLSPERYQKIDSECRRCGRLPLLAEHTSNAENRHHATHENWIVEPVFGGDAAGIPAVEFQRVPAHSKTHRWPR